MDNDKTVKNVEKSESGENELIRRYTASTIKEIVIIIVVSIPLFVLAAYFDVLEAIVEFSQKHENYEIDEFLTLLIVTFFGMLAFSWRRWRDIQVLGNNLIVRNNELKEALEQIRTLQGILPICSSCRRIRDDNNQWQPMETYVLNHTEAQFSHGLCPDCAKKLYPNIYKAGNGS